jgi:hypothetical protein
MAHPALSLQADITSTEAALSGRIAAKGSAPPFSPCGNAVGELQLSLTRPPAILDAGYHGDHRTILCERNPASDAANSNADIAVRT